MLLSCLVTCVAVACGVGVRAEDGPVGINTPRVFSSFDPGAATCNSPPSLNKSLAFAQDNEREFIKGNRERARNGGQGPGPELLGIRCKQ
jgi:ribose transport system substrate-binding protein